MNQTGQHLRRGYTTGACAAAAARAAFMAMSGARVPAPLPLLLPTGDILHIPVNIISQSSSSALAAVIKDAGDDPDVTDKMEIRVRVEATSEATGNPEDYCEPCGLGTVIIGADKGIGLVTRPGLEATVGKWAINPAPRNMIRTNLQKAGFGTKPGILRLTISAVGGEEVARRTLNPTLGITGGISILGNTGIVEPYSNAAYIHTIRIHLRCAAETGNTEVALTTGSRTQTAIRRDRPKLTEATCIRIGDFIADSLKAASEANLQTVNIACMPGKLYKYACGHEYTHAHNNELKTDLLTDLLCQQGVGEDTLLRIAACHTVGEAASHLAALVYSSLLDQLGDLAMVNLGKWGPKCHINLHVYDNLGNIILKRTSDS